MEVNNQHIIDPKTIQDVKAFEWIAKLLAKGFLHGKHDAVRLGAGMEFQQYRPYVSGDDIRSIDWKMFAKTDKYYIKQTSIQTEHQYLFIIDNSLSMKYSENGWSKLWYAKLMTAAMMCVLSNQGDHFAWQSGKQLMTMGSGKRHWQHCLETLFRLDFEEGNDFVQPMKQSSTTFIWMSDFYHPILEVQEYIKKLKHPQTELIMFHILGHAEKFLDFGSNMTFVDLETKQRIDVNANATRKEYEKNLSAHLAKIKNLSFKSGAIYEEVSLNGNITETLRRFFHHYQYTAL
ncbi:DUF58 domain-containing protein [Portibacter lacus]|uniref:DUF58 domain-containing protein n=1 Tax=Portibacter lacus TaxID=1099794 RepID=A0AA37WD30_9BACT|nr:DUF58 domain-containing protein [Portibacter lacus]GLR17516.1 hypothetical protein GCM10007940_21310 [Portibacter lacus]